MTPYQRQLLMEMIAAEQNNGNGNGYPQMGGQYPPQMPVNPGMYPGAYPMNPMGNGYPQGGGREIEIPVRLIPQTGPPPMQMMGGYPPMGQRPTPQAPPRQGLSFTDVAVVFLLLFVFSLFLFAALGIDIGAGR